jgi:hypothetical protein
VLAVCDYGFAFVQRQFLRRPKNLVAHPVRDIRHLVLIELYHFRFRQIEIRIVRRHHGVAIHGARQFRRACHAAGNHRIRQQRARLNTSANILARPANTCLTIAA